MKKIILTFLFCLSVSISFSQSKIWTTTSEKGEFQGYSIEKLDANNSAVLALDFIAFQQQLENVPLRGVSTRVSKTLISLPNNKGVMQVFNMIEVLSY